MGSDSFEGIDLREATNSENKSRASAEGESGLLGMEWVRGSNREPCLKNVRANAHFSVSATNRKDIPGNKI
jgi:hypothetical protein